MNIKIFSVILACSLAPIIQANLANASGVEDLAISRVGSFFVTPKAPSVVFYYGDIVDGDSFDFRKILRANEAVDTLVLASNGGSVYEALQISGIVHDKHLKTYVPPNSICASACSFAYFAGSERVADGDLGVHQFSSKSPNNSEEIAQYTVSEIISFLNSFDVPPFVFEKMFETQSSQMYFFNMEEKSKIEISSIHELDWRAPINSFLNELSQAVAEIPIDAPPTKAAPPQDDKELTRHIQSELNRIGCNVGNPDGVIGAKSLSGLSRFSKISGLEPKEDLFQSEDFLRILQAKPVGFCPKIAPNPEILIAKNWSSVAKCGSGTVNGSISLTPANDGRGKSNYYMYYTNLAGQVWVGLASKSGMNFSFELEIKKGASKIRTLTGSGRFESNFTHLNGVDSLGCYFYATAM